MDAVVVGIIAGIAAGAGVYIGTATLRDRVSDLTAEVRAIRRHLVTPGDGVGDAERAALAVLEAGRAVPVEHIAMSSGLTEDDVRLILSDLVHRGVVVQEGSHFRLG